MGLNIKTSELSPGERLKIYRRRKGLNQDAMADSLGLSLYAYRRVEEESDLCDFVPPLGHLSQREQCYIARLRRGWTLAQAAEKIPCSRWWLRKMERGDAPINKLWNFWNP